MEIYNFQLNLSFIMSHKYSCAGFSSFYEDLQILQYFNSPLYLAISTQEKG